MEFQGRLMSGSDKVVDMPAVQAENKSEKDAQRPAAQDAASATPSGAARGRGRGPQGPGPRPGAPERVETVFRPGEPAPQPATAPHRVMSVEGYSEQRVGARRA